MRLSIDQRDEGYAEALRHGIDMRYVKIWLDDVEQPYAVTADDESGFVLRYIERQTAAGRRFVPTGDSSNFLRELVRGIVRVELLAKPDGAWPHWGVVQPEAPRRWPGCWPGQRPEGSAITRAAPAGEAALPSRPIAVEWGEPPAHVSRPWVQEACGIGIDQLRADRADAGG